MPALRLSRPTYLETALVPSCKSDSSFDAGPKSDKPMHAAFDKLAESEVRTSTHRANETLRRIHSLARRAGMLFLGKGLWLLPFNAFLAT